MNFLKICFLILLDVRKDYHTKFIGVHNFKEIIKINSFCVILKNYIFILKSNRSGFSRQFEWNECIEECISLVTKTTTPCKLCINKVHCFVSNVRSKMHLGLKNIWFQWGEGGILWFVWEVIKSMLELGWGDLQLCKALQQLLPIQLTQRLNAVRNKPQFVHTTSDTQFKY